MIVSETIEIPDREKTHSASLSVLKHILTETQFMSRNTPALMTCCMHLNRKPPFKTERLKPQHIHTAVQDESHSSYSLAAALTRPCCDIKYSTTVESVFFLKAISHYQLSAVNYSFHGERLVFALRTINTTRLSILSSFIQRCSWRALLLLKDRCETLMRTIWRPTYHFKDWGFRELYTYSRLTLIVIQKWWDGVKY